MPDRLELLVAASNRRNHGQRAHHAKQQRDVVVARPVHGPGPHDHPIAAESFDNLFGDALRLVVCGRAALSAERRHVDEFLNAGPFGFRKYPPGAVDIH